MQEATVCHLLRENKGTVEALLGKRNKLFCNGIWNGVGGRKRKRETPVTCIARETVEEVGTRIVRDFLRHFATIDFYYPVEQGGYSLDWRVHYFQAPVWEGEPAIVDGFSELRWFPYGKLPYGWMMSDQGYWMPAALEAWRRNLRLTGVVHYGDSAMSTVEKVTLGFVPMQ